MSEINYLNKNLLIMSKNMLSTYLLIYQSMRSKSKFDHMLLKSCSSIATFQNLYKNSRNMGHMQL